MNPKHLKELALSKQKKEVATPLINEDQILSDVQSLETYIAIKALEGLMELKYEFIANSDGDITPEYVLAVANSFKEKYPDFMVITNLGNNSIIITWHGENEA